MTELSPTTLNLFVECKRCFWLRVNEGRERPESGFPSAIGEFDRDIKSHFDDHRGTGRPPPALRDADAPERLLADSELVDRCRSWQTAPQYVDSDAGATLVGALDDVLVTDGDELVVLDYKTRASLPETPHGHYRRQLAVYTLLLRAAGHSTADYGMLLYFVPSAFDDAEGLRFETTLVRVSLAVEAVRGLFERAANVADGEIPPPDGDCQFCRWAARNAERPSFD